MTILATDNFNRANEDPIASPWVAGAGSDRMTLATNAMAPNSVGADAWAYYDGAISWPNDQYCKFKVAVTGTAGGGSGAGLMVRKAAGTSDQTRYELILDHAASNNCTLRRRDSGGTPTNIVVFTQAWSDGNTWELRAQGTTLSMWLNGVQVNTNQTDATIASGFLGGTYSSTETSASLEDFEGGNFAGGGGSPAVDSDYLIYQVRMKY